MNKNLFFYSYRNAFIFACENGQYDIIQLLIKNHCHLNVKDGDGMAGFMHACEKKWFTNCSIILIENTNCSIFDKKKS